jgi:hypothetical protein
MLVRSNARILGIFDGQRRRGEVGLRRWFRIEEYGFEFQPKFF